MQYKRYLKNLFLTRKRQKLTALFSFFIIYVLMLAGVFSYFHGEDRVSNRLAAKNGSVTVQEPAWDSKGQFMAQYAEPGMQIPKNPSAYNDGQIDLYVRLKMTVTLEPYQGRLKDVDTVNGYVGIPTDAGRLERIINALRDENGEPFITLTTHENDAPLPVSEWKIASCSHTAYIPEESNYSAEEGERLKDHILVFYFYYTGGDKDNGTDMMRVVRPEESTAELFSYVEIPVYKKDYLGVFDQQYQITLQAESIPVRAGEPLSASDASVRFATEKN